MVKLKRPTKLVGWFYGEPGTPRRLSRPGVLALSGGALAALALTTAVAAGRSALDLVASPASHFTPRRNAEGLAVNAYAVALENRGEGPLAIRLALDVPGAPGGEIRLRPDALTLAPGEHRRLTVVAEARLARPGRLEARLTAEAGAVRAARAVPLVIPEAR